MLTLESSDPPCVACRERAGTTMVEVTDAVKAWLCGPCAAPFVTTNTTVQTMFSDDEGEGL